MIPTYYLIDSCVIFTVDFNIFSPSIINLGPHSQCSLKEIPKFLQNLRLQYNILEMYFQLIF